MEEKTLKSNWKQLGKDFASLGKDLGKTLVKTVRKGVDVATDWAEDKPEAEQKEPEQPEA